MGFPSGATRTLLGGSAAPAATQDSAAMTELEDVGRLQIEQDERFQRLSWRVQRICWALMVVTVALALLGAFGDGPLANAHAGTAQDALSIRYERIVRRESPTTFLVDIRTDAVADSVARVWVAQSLIDHVDVERITPEPARSFAAGDRIVYEFPIAPGEATSRVVFEVQPLGYWSQRGAIGLIDGPSHTFRQFVLP